MKSILFTLVLTLSSSIANASDLSYGAGLKYSFYSYSDSKGTANLDSAFTPNLNIEYKLTGRGRYASLDLDYYSTSGKASGSNTGQNAQGYGLTAKYLHQINFSRDFKDFFGGVGAKFSQIDLDSRHSVDGDDFLDETFSDESITTIAAALSAHKLFYFGKRKNRAFKAGVFLDYPIGSGITEYGITANLHF